MDTPSFDPGQFGLASEPEVVVELPDEEATRQLGRALAERLEAGAFIGLVGDLGAGKTTLVQALVETLEPAAEATSPTYTLLNEYETDPPVIHVDLYRLDSYDELESIAYWDYVESGAAITCVEWLDRVPEAWPRHGLVVLLEHTGEARRARVWASEEWRKAIHGLELGRRNG